MLHKQPQKPTNSQANSASKPPDDELTQHLRQAARRKRPWSIGSCLLTLLLCAIPAALGTWWLWPRGEPIHLATVAFDQVAHPGQAVKLTAAALHAEQDEVFPVHGITLFFQEITPGGEQRKPIRVLTNRVGFAQAELPLHPPSDMAIVEVVFIDDTSHQPSFSRDQAHIFCWPPDAPLLVMDVEHSVKTAADWPEFATALREAAKAGWHVVYLVVDAQTALGYRAKRDWLQDKARSGNDPIPLGPVLGQQAWHPPRPPTVARKELLASLNGEFTGKLLYLTFDGAIELRTPAANGDTSGEAVVVASWANLATALAATGQTR